MPGSPTPTVIRTLRFKVRREGYAWLEAAAADVNHAWSWANEVSDKAALPYSGSARFALKGWGRLTASRLPCLLSCAHKI